MSTDTTPSTSQTRHNMTDQVTDLVFTTGISKKTGNPYIVGSVTIDTPNGPYEFSLEYLDKNAQNAARAAIERKENKQIEAFAEGLKD